jgi:hypothetical protein
MSKLPGFELTFWDCITFLAIAVCVVLFLSCFIWREDTIPFGLPNAT